MTHFNKTKVKKKATTPASQKMVTIIKTQQHHEVAYQHQKHLLPLPYKKQYLTQTSGKSNPSSWKTGLLNWRTEWSFLKLNYLSLKKSVNFSKKGSTIRSNTWHNHTLLQTAWWNLTKRMITIPIPKKFSQHSSKKVGFGKTL